MGATMSIEENLVVVTPIDQRAAQPIATTEQSMEDAPAWISRLADEQASILESKRVWEMDTGADALDALSRRNPRQRRAHFVEVTVRFQASTAGLRLSGVYLTVPGPKVNGRSVYARGSEYLLYLDDGTWVVKEGPASNSDCYVYAFVEDNAL